LRLALGCAVLVLCGCETAPGSELGDGGWFTDALSPDSTPPRPSFRFEPGVVVFEEPGVVPVELANSSDVLARIAAPPELTDCSVNSGNPVCVDGLGPLVVEARSSLVLNVRLRKPMIKEHGGSALREFHFRVLGSSETQSMIVMDRSDFWNCNATLDHRSCEFQEATVSVLCAAAGSLPPGSTIQIGDVEGVSVIDSSISGSQLTVELRITNRTVPGELGLTCNFLEMALIIVCPILPSHRSRRALNWDSPAIPLTSAR